MADFQEATAVRGDGTSFTATLDPEWTVNGNPHGGYLLAMMARAAAATDSDHPDSDHPGDARAGGVRHPHPLSASAVYLAPPRVGPATITVEPLRRGRFASQLRARLRQNDRPCVEAHFTLGCHRETARSRWIGLAPVEVAPEHTCPVSPVEPPGSGVTVAMLRLVEQRIDPASAGGGSGEVSGWLRFANGADFDPVSLLFAADSFPPATLTLGSVGWAPTLELTVYVRGLPAPGPLRVRQRARLLHGDTSGTMTPGTRTSDTRTVDAMTVDQVCEVWDSRDHLVAQATQLALVRMARADR